MPISTQSPLVQEVWGRGQTVRLTQLLSSSIASSKICWTVRWGRVAIGRCLCRLFLRLPEPDLLRLSARQHRRQLHLQLADQPVGDAIAKLNIPEFGYVQAGIYDVNGSYLTYENKLWPVWYSDSDGVLIPFEIAWLPKFDGGRLPGSYKIGAWYSTATLSDVVSDVSGSVPCNDRPAGESVHGTLWFLPELRAAAHAQLLPRPEGRAERLCELLDRGRGDVGHLAASRGRIDLHRPVRLAPA